ncbi:sulfotransferase [Halieaceae bacterium IMCC14734]|uniref:Sulfotransferase n=1 Tax=Candidatus Litorirhabdus singularis TaxID=2518993 RepID=A0ABT3TJD7_9GAMM|nr:sulfotransferase domain-containing protein [Candidatus Litorirhabdus singularis]MCX2982428.1 sulfotransferase [Candidatus Litorirhabdus singularis]
MVYFIQLVRQFFQTATRKLERRWLHLRLRGRPESELLAAERVLRGKDQLKLLRRSDIAVVSFGKSGRTWLRVMVSHLFRVKYGLPDNALLGMDNFHNMNKAIPKIFFTHDNYIKDFTGAAESKKPFYDKPVVLLARDPRDVAVSQYFQWKFRLRPNKVAINNYPERGSDISLFDFVTGDNGGSMAAVCEYLNLWALEAPNIQQYLVLRYEDLRADPAPHLQRMLDFMKVDATAEQVTAAVEYSAFENMKKLESSSKFRLAGERMKPGDKNNPDSFKTRRAKVGGFRDYFSDEEVAAIDAQLEASLDPVYGYRKTAAVD